MPKRTSSSSSSTSKYGPKPTLLKARAVFGADGQYLSREVITAMQRANGYAVYKVPGPNAAKALDVAVQCMCWQSAPCQHSVVVRYANRAPLRALLDAPVIAGLMHVLGVRAPPPASRIIACPFFDTADANVARACELLGLPPT